ncbi:MAG: NADH-quinone oxidoreductase subunit C [Candidatus Omnitrophica bacterium]|nr:NADH-quinone oxidoreductase subunit C [Candidatus Omnitrophota bacterium]
MLDNPSLFDLLHQRFPAAILSTHAHRGDATVTIRSEYLLDVARFLRDEPGFRMNFLMDLTAVDYLTFGQKPPGRAAHFNAGVAVRPPAFIQDQIPWPGPATGARFEVVYHFYSLETGHRLRLKVPVEEDSPQVDSLTPVWASADWFEREVWDMFGIRFKGHPNLKRILMYEEFQGHPLRKDYPVNRRQPLIGPIN